MGRRKPVKRRPAAKQPDKPLSKAGKITVIATFAFLAIAILISSLTSKSSLVAQPTTTRAAPTKTSPTYKTDIVRYTYTKADGTPWPWKMDSITVTCTTMGGEATAVVNGQTYGITGAEAVNWHLRGYANESAILVHPDADDPTYVPFMDRVYADCRAGMVGH